jgi:hypothetical protein
MRGKFIFEAIQEGEDESLRQIYFNPPLVIEYSIYDKIDKETGKENYPEDSDLMGFFTFDFGMMGECSLDSKNNFLSHGYEGLTKESPVEDVLMKSIMFDLFHAFFHTSQDPNYGFYHHALYAYLKDRTILKGD